MEVGAVIAGTTFAGTFLHIEGEGPDLIDQNLAKVISSDCVQES